MKSALARLVPLLLCVATGPPAAAAEKGQIGLRLNLEPLPFGRLSGGVSFQISDRLSVRPTLGFGWSSSRLGYNRTFFSLGGRAFYHFNPGGRLSPYVGGGLAYSHRDPRKGFDLPGFPGELREPTTDHHFLTLSAGAGLRYRLGRKLDLFAEIGQAVSTGRRFEWTGSTWGKRSAFDAEVRFRPAIGLSFNLK